jgi:hypothetical protein
MSRHLHARPRPRRVLAAAAALARDWWDRANARMERRDVFAHIPQAPDNWSPRDEWADPLEVHHPRNLPSPAERTERIKADGVDERRAGEPYLHGRGRAENATATAAVLPPREYLPPAVEVQPDLTETGYRAAQKAELARRLAQDLIAAVSPAAITRNAFDYCLSDVYRRLNAWSTA